jgi:hypothetical protein
MVLRARRVELRGIADPSAHARERARDELLDEEGVSRQVVFGREAELAGRSEAEARVVAGCLRTTIPRGVFRLVDRGADESEPIPRR